MCYVCVCMSLLEMYFKAKKCVIVVSLYYERVLCIIWNTYAISWLYVSMKYMKDAPLIICAY